MQGAALVAIGSSVLLAACSDPTPRENAALKASEQSGRMRVISAQEIRDARGYSRDILVIKDSETGREYLAVMGAGVQQIVTRSNGKSSYTVEE